MCALSILRLDKGRGVLSNAESCRKSETAECCPVMKKLWGTLRIFCTAALALRPYSNQAITGQEKDFVVREQSAVSKALSGCVTTVRERTLDFTCFSAY